MTFGAAVADGGKGVEAAASGEARSPETYIGYARSARSVSEPAPLRDAPARYAAHPGRLNDWGLTGTWTIGAEHATSGGAGSRILYRFHARDLHLVLGPGAGGHPIRFRVTIDGKAPGTDHGADIDAAGTGTVDGQRLYQLVRLGGPVLDHDFAIEFLDPGVEAYSFTFG